MMVFFLSQSTSRAGRKTVPGNLAIVEKCDRFEERSDSRENDFIVNVFPFLAARFFFFQFFSKKMILTNHAITSR